MLSRNHCLVVKLIFLQLLFSLCCGFVSYQPEQIHLSYGDTPYEIVVTWSTLHNTTVSVVEYGIGGLILRASNWNITAYHYGVGLNRLQYIHRVKLQNLTASSKYEYHCGSDLGWSNLLSFRTPPEEKSFSPFLAVYGDLGNTNAMSLSRLQEETQRGMYDAIIHVGDFAYDMDSENGTVGDEFMQQIETIASYLPYMTCPGNHEEANNFSDYRMRFSMPGNSEGLWYSFNMGPVHFVSISTEVYYYLEYGLKLITKQFEWLQSDLKEATKPLNRKLRPWIIVYGHRPMYCSNKNLDDCTYYETITRTGVPFVKWFGLEDMMYEYGVDLMIWAHEHSYERLWPLYDYNVLNGSYDQPYVNPKAPVHVTTGSAGCKEEHDMFKKNQPRWSAFRSDDYGYSRLKVHNSTHLYMEYVSVDKLGEVIDQFWLVKNAHGPYKNSNEDIS